MFEYIYTPEVQHMEPNTNNQPLEVWRFGTWKKIIFGFHVKLFWGCTYPFFFLWRWWNISHLGCEFRIVRYETTSTYHEMLKFWWKLCVCVFCLFCFFIRKKMRPFYCPLFTRRRAEHRNFKSMNFFKLYLPEINQRCFILFWKSLDKRQDCHMGVWWFFYLG